MKFSAGMQALSVLALVAVGGCANLKELNNYSVASTAVVRNFEGHQHDFSRYCAERCMIEAIASFEVKRSLDCPCDLYRQADSATQMIYTAVRCYFEGLARVSNDELTVYNFDPLKKSLAEGSFGAIPISGEQSAAYVNLSRVLLNATAGAYRKDKVKDFIREANGPVQVLLSKWRLIVETNMVNELKFKKERLYNYYNDLKRSPNITDFEKVKAVQEYYVQLAALNNAQAGLEQYARGIRAIAEGHQLLFDALNRLNADETRARIQQFANEIRATIPF